jgi:hypothetical protein
MPAANPSQIIDNLMSSAKTTKSFHFAVDLSGTVDSSMLADGSAGAGGRTIKLDGTSIVGDVDVVNKAVHVTATAPSIPVDADVIVTGGFAYYKTSLTGPMYVKTDLSALGSMAGGGMMMPTPGPSAMADMQAELAKIRAQLDAAGVKATLVGIDQVNGQNAYHISVSVPIDKINAAIAAHASPAPAGGVPSLTSASVDAWVYTADKRLAKFEAKASSAAIGNVDLVVTVTNYDQPVTIAAPPASQVTTTP